MNALSIQEFVPVLILAFTGATLRYFILAGMTFYMGYIRQPPAGLRKLQPRWPDARQIRHELLYSLQTMLVFSLVGSCVWLAYRNGYTHLYEPWDAYGRGYWVLTLLLQLVIHDTYFYWMHRLLHQPWWFRHVHYVHHRSHNPTPWAANAFHPVEALLQSSGFTLIIVVLPVSVSALLLFSFVIITMNVIGHSGYEFLPDNFDRHWMGKWLGSSTHHNRHHQYSRGNFGFYFNIWDRLMKTELKTRK